MSKLTRDGTAEPVSRDQILRHVRGQGNIDFPCSADLEQDWQPYPVDPYSAICDDHTYIHQKKNKLKQVGGKDSKCLAVFTTYASKSRNAATATAAAKKMLLQSFYTLVYKKDRSPP